MAAYRRPSLGEHDSSATDAPASRLKGAIDGASWNAVRALKMLDELDGAYGGPRRQARTPGAIRPSDGSNHPPAADRGYLPIQDLTRRSAPAFPSMSAGNPQPGDDVIVLDERIVASMSRDLGFRLPINAKLYCNGMAVGRLVTVAGDLAVVDFQNEIVNLPYKAITAAVNLGAVRRKQPVAMDMKEAQLSQMVRSLRLKSEALRRKDDELTSRKTEVFLLKRQLDRLGMAAWVHAPVMDQKALYLPKADVSIPVGTDITHHLEQPPGGKPPPPAAGAEPAADPPETPADADTAAAAAPPPAAAAGIVLGAEGYCSLVAGGGGRQLAARNDTEAMQIDFCLRVHQDGVRAGPRVLWAAAAPRTFTMRVFPGETMPLVDLHEAWTGSYSVSFSYGPVTDKAFLTGLYKLRSAAPTKERQALQAFPTAFTPSSPHSMMSLPPDSPGDLAHTAIANDHPFIDVDFPPDVHSILGREQGTIKHFPASWMRPSQFMTPAPALFDPTGPLNTAGIVPGGLGDVHFTDAARVLGGPRPQDPGGVSLKKLFMPPLSDEAAARERSLGLHRVLLCVNGWWCWYTVDDYLPMQNGTHQQLAYARTEDPPELWLPLLQKALAKTRGSYNKVAHGDVTTVVQDLTGCPSQVYDLDEPNAFFYIRQHVADHRPVVLRSISIDVTTHIDEVTKLRASGFEGGRLYEIVDTKHLDEKDISLVKIRNATGGAAQWAGEWAKGGAGWTSHPEASAAAAPAPAGQQPGDSEPPVEQPQGEGQPGEEAADAEKNEADEPKSAAAPAAEPAAQAAPPEGSDDDCVWLAYDEVKEHFDGAAAFLVTPAWNEVRFRTGFREARPVHVFEIQVFKDTECLVSTMQSLHAEIPSALRLEVAERVGLNTWQTVVQSDAKYIRGTQLNTSFFHLRAGCCYIIVIQQWTQEENRLCRNRRDVVLRIATAEDNYGCLRVAELNTDMNDRLQYEGYPGFDPAKGREARLEAQVNRIDADSRTVMPFSQRERINNFLQPPGAAASELNASSSAYGDPRGDFHEARPDPLETAARLRMHVGTLLHSLHPHDQEMLAGLADSLGRGEAAMLDYVTKIYSR
ncbi:hypothetical protein DIPPA_29517 [Diplonema papillatum]|nr:hypothetical protein DIPPA_29517 [Diplonema papillatum]